MGKIRLRCHTFKPDNRKITILLNAWNTCRSAPERRATKTGLNNFAGMVDEYLCARFATDPRLKKRFLISPVLPTIKGGTSHRGFTGFVMIQSAKRIFALPESPFLRGIAFLPAGNSGKIRQFKPMITQRQSHLGQAIHMRPKLPLPHSNLARPFSSNVSATQSECS